MNKPTKPMILWFLSWFAFCIAVLIIAFTVPGCARLKVAGVDYYDCKTHKCKVLWAYDRAMTAAENHSISLNQGNTMAQRVAIEEYRFTGRVLKKIYDGKYVTKAEIKCALSWMKGSRATHPEHLHDFDHIIWVLEKELEKR